MELMGGFGGWICVEERAGRFKDISRYKECYSWSLGALSTPESHLHITIAIAECIVASNRHHALRIAEASPGIDVGW
jgi:hypothetical protein